MATSKRIQAAARIVFLYRLKDGRYSKPDVQPATGETPVATLLGLIIQWDRVFPESAAG